MGRLASRKRNSLGIEPRTPNGKALIDMPAIHLAMSDVAIISHPEYDKYILENVRSFIWT